MTERVLGHPIISHRFCANSADGPGGSGWGQTPLQSPVSSLQAVGQRWTVNHHYHLVFIYYLFSSSSLFISFRGHKVLQSCVPVCLSICICVSMSAHVSGNLISKLYPFVG